MKTWAISFWLTVLISRARHLHPICRPLHNRGKCRPGGRFSPLAGRGRHFGGPEEYRKQGQRRGGSAGDDLGVEVAPGAGLADAARPAEGEPDGLADVRDGEIDAVGDAGDHGEQGHGFRVGGGGAADLLADLEAQGAWRLGKSWLEWVVLWQRQPVGGNGPAWQAQKRGFVIFRGKSRRLVTWNKHLANPRNWRRISDCVAKFGYRATVICAPEDLIGDDN